MCHPPQRGTWWLGRSPLVHRGFMIAWAANGLAKRVVAAIKQAVADSGAPASAMRILITGAPRCVGAARGIWRDCFGSDCRGLELCLHAWQNSAKK